MRHLIGFDSIKGVLLSVMSAAVLVMGLAPSQAVAEEKKTQKINSRQNAESDELKSKPAPQRPYYMLSPEDRAILQSGPISQTQYIVGGILGTYPGLGIGHAVQGLWLERGWKFTAAQLGAIALVSIGAGECFGGMFDDDGASDDDCDKMMLGILGYIGARVWEIYDVWTFANQRNARHMQLRVIVETHQVSQIPRADGGLLSLTWRF
jgi:hypothetical protein